MKWRNNTQFTAVSAANGAFVISLAPGWYEVTATKNGFVKASRRESGSSPGERLRLELPLAFNHAALESAMVQENRIHEGARRSNWKPS